MLCRRCAYAANLERAEFVKPAPAVAKTGKPLQQVSTPGVKTIDDLVAFFGAPAGQMLKTVVYATTDRLVATLIRGDLAVNEAKLARVLGTPNFHLATDDELRAAGIHPGYVSPVGLSGAFIVADDSLDAEAEYIAGANVPDAHLVHVHYGRDFKPDKVADIATAREGDPCPRCGGPLHAERGIEAGHTFKLGTKYSASMGATYLGPDGKEHPIVMGSYGIGLDRLIASLVEQHHDEQGIIWPRAVAPFDAHVVGLGMDTPQVARYAEDVYRELGEAGFEVLFDDREETPGVKFNDADLIGLPLRVTVSPRNIREDQVELKLRARKESHLVRREELVRRARSLSST
jgi:prolyl-tRNA synthetase